MVEMERAARAFARGRLGGEAAGDLGQVAGDDLRGVRAAAVEDDLQVDRGSRFDAAGEIRPISTAAMTSWPSIASRTSSLVGGGFDPAEGRRSLDALHQFLSPMATVAIEDHHIDIADLERRRIGEDEELHERRADQDGAALRVAQHGQQFLDDQGSKARPPHQPILFLVLRAASTKNTAPIASMTAIECRNIGQMSPARNTVCRLGIR